MGCIYRATLISDGKSYTGQTVSTLRERKYYHEWEAKRPSERKMYFHSALMKYGFDAFEWTVLFDNVPDGFLNRLEINLIEKFNTVVPHGFNVMTGGGSLGRNSEEGRRRIREGLKKPGVREKMSASIRLAYTDPKVREKLSASLKTTLNTPEMKARYSAIHRRVQNLPEVKARHLAAVTAAVNTPEAKAKKIESMKRSWADPAVRAYRKEVNQRPEVRQRKSDSKKGIPQSEDHVRKRMESRKKTLERKRICSIILEILK